MKREFYNDCTFPGARAFPIQLRPLIAYLVPGATVLAVPALLSPFSVPGSPHNPLTCRPSGLPVPHVASLTAGMTVSAVRWSWSIPCIAGLAWQCPAQFSALAGMWRRSTSSFRIHYEHYHFYANMGIATAAAYACYRVKLGGLLPLGWPDLGFVLVGNRVLHNVPRTRCANTTGAVSSSLGKRNSLPLGICVIQREAAHRITSPSPVPAPAAGTNSMRLIPRVRQIVRSWMMSRRRSPRSVLLTYDCDCRSFLARSTCVRPALSRVSFRSRRTAAYSRCRSIFPSVPAFALLPLR